MILCQLVMIINFLSTNQTCTHIHILTASHLPTETVSKLRRP